MWIIPLLLLFLTPLAWLFGRLSKAVSSNRIKDKRILLTLPSAFLFLAGLASSFPHLLGNGRMMAQEVLNGSNGKTVLLLFILKAIVVFIILWAGAMVVPYAIFCLGDGWSCSLGHDSRFGKSANHFYFWDLFAFYL